MLFNHDINVVKENESANKNHKFLFAEKNLEV